VERDDSDTLRQLRYRIIGWLHVGRVRPGDRLPSIREVARQSGVDHRAVADAYRALAAEGLVEIRAGSGVYVAAGEPAGTVHPETAGWLGRVLAEGWVRRIPRAELGGLVARCAEMQLCCACIESTEDHMVALGAELEEEFSLQVRPVLVPPDATPRAVRPEHLAGADLVVTTVFHASLGRAAAAAARLPLVVAGINPEFAAELRDRLVRTSPTAVVADPLYRIRAETYLAATPERNRARFLLVDELGSAGDVDLQSDAVLITRAARRRLGLKEYHFIPSPSFISRESAWELCGVIARLALERTAG
jgi:DNA-binding transcriptional regulator YhcF (GntR family)